MPPSFLIVRFSAIGDCVMTAYIATAIRTLMPDCRLVWAVDTRCKPVLEQEKMLDDVVDFPRDEWKKSRWSPQVWRQQLSRFAKLRKMSFDYGLDLQGHSKTAVCLRIAAPRERIAAFATDPLARRLNPLASGDPDGCHRVERMIATARKFGEFEIPKLPLMPQPISRTELGIPEGRLASISTGAGAQVKQVPAEHWRLVAENLLAKGYGVVFLGASSDPRIDLSGAIDCVGKWSLEQTMSAVASTQIHLAADTGTGHMAAAYGVPFISVFGPTDPKLYRPYSDLGRVLRASGVPGDVTTSAILGAVEELIG